MLTTPQRNNINSVLHKSEEMPVSLELTQSASYSLCPNDLKW